MYRSDLMRPVLLAVDGPVSDHARSRGWHRLETFFNPAGFFEEVHIVSMCDTYRYDSRRIGSIIVHPVRIVAPHPALKVPFNLLAMGLATWRTWCLARSMKPALISQTYGGPLKMGFPAVLVARALGLPSVITLHSDYPSAMSWTYSRPLRYVAMIVWKYLFRNATQIRSVSQAAAEFPLSLGVPAERITVIPNKEDPALFQAPPTRTEMSDAAQKFGFAEVPSHAVVLLTVGRLIPARNIDGMLRAVALAVHAGADVYYFVAGEGPERGALASLARALGLDDRVRFLGFLPHQDLRCVYRLADVLLFVTHYEGQPRVVVEAMLAGLPVVCSNFGQVCEVVVDGRNGLHADPQSPEDIARAIQTFAAGWETRTKSDQGGGFDPKVFSVETVNQQEVEFYRSLLTLPATAGQPANSCYENPEASSNGA